MSWYVSPAWLPDPSTRQPLTLHTFTYELLPPILCYYATAFLVLLPNTYPVRLALLPITLYTAFRASTQVDLAKGFAEEERLAYLSHGLLLAMTTVGMRVSIWTFQLTPYRRLKPSGSLILDALDLSYNLRGIGWSWSQGLKIPHESRDTASTPRFLLSTLRSFLLTYTLFDALLLSVQSFPGINSPTGTSASIFDPSLPPITRYLRSSLITLLSGLVVYSSILFIHLLLTLLCITLLQHKPTDWPPIFHRPWLSTSLNQFWSTRWHQFFRHNFIAFGGVPFYFLFGRVGGIMGVFLVSGILHHFGLWGMGRGSDFAAVVGFFVMMGVGTLLEYAFKAATGRRVQGVWGWVWVMLWVVGWANMLVEAWLSRGLAGSLFQPQDTRPALWMARLVRERLRSAGYY